MAPDPARLREAYARQIAHFERLKREHDALVTAEGGKPSKQSDSLFEAMAAALDEASRTLLQALDAEGALRSAASGRA